MRNRPFKAPRNYFFMSDFLYLRLFRLEYFKRIQTIKISLSRHLNYKINFLLTMVLPVFVFFVIKYNLWQSIYALHPEAEIKGYSLSKMIEYQFWILIIDLFVRSHFFSQNISADIRLGKISAFLLYPFSFISYQVSLFASDKLIQLFIGAFSLALAIVFSWLELPSLIVLLKSALFVLMAGTFWLLAQLIIGFIAFWLEETWSLNISLRFISAFFAGSFIPLDLFPELLAKALMWTPFPYLTYIPVRILMGEAIPLGPAFFILFFWLLILFFCAKLIWKKGLKLYTGAGI